MPLRFFLSLILLLVNSLFFANNVFALERNELENRIYYLKNRSDIHSLYVNGIRPSSNIGAIREAFEALKSSHLKVLAIQQIATLVETEQCHSYFQLNNQAYQKIFDTIEFLLVSNRVGELRDVGRYFKRKQFNQTLKPLENDVAVAVIQFEFLYRVLPTYDSIFLNNKEAKPGLFGTRPTVCLQDHRAELQQLYSQRLQDLEILKLLLIGKRGVWDVATLSNTLVASALKEVKAIKYLGLKLGGMLLVGYFAAPLVGGVLTTQLPMYAAQIKTAFWGLSTVYGLYEGAKSGFKVWSIFKDNEEEMYFSEVEEMMGFIQSATTLPSSQVQLYHLVAAYETQYHREMLKLSPDATTKSWYPDALNKHASDDKIIEAYQLELDQIR